MKKGIKDGGYSYTVTMEQIKKWRAVPPEMRLEWLAELNALLYQAHSPKTRLIWEKFRRGEV